VIPLGLLSKAVIFVISPTRFFKTIGLIGPNSNNLDAIGGNYLPTTDVMSTPLAAIKNRTKSTIIHAPGCWYTYCNTTELFSDAVTVAKNSDLLLLFFGNDQKIEREGFDRNNITLPGFQEDLIKEVVSAAGNIPVVLVLFNGGPLSLSDWSLEHVPAIVEAFFPGEEGSDAIFDVIFGDFNPGGRLPYTVFKSVDDLPPMTDMSMAERTYRYSTKSPQFFFGDGISYTTFSFTQLQMITTPVILPCESVILHVTVTNSGNYSGNAVVQVYISNKSAKVPVPNISLVAFEGGIQLKPGQSQVVELSIDPDWMSIVTDDGRQIIDSDHFEVYVGGNHPMSKMNTGTLMTEFDVKGSRLLSECG